MRKKNQTVEELTNEINDLNTHLSHLVAEKNERMNQIQNITKKNKQLQNMVEVLKNNREQIQVAQKKYKDEYEIRNKGLENRYKSDIAICEQNIEIVCERTRPYLEKLRLLEETKRKYEELWREKQMQNQKLISELNLNIQMMKTKKKEIHNRLELAKSVCPMPASNCFEDTLQDTPLFKFSHTIDSAFPIESDFDPIVSLKRSIYIKQSHLRELEEICTRLSEERTALVEDDIMETPVD